MLSLYAQACVPCCEQYTTLAQHKLEGLDELIGFFFSLIDGFKRKRHDLLDFQRNEFDRDYVEFNARIQELEGRRAHSKASAFMSRNLTPLCTGSLLF